MRDLWLVLPKLDIRSMSLEDPFCPEMPSYLVR